MDIDKGTLARLQHIRLPKRHYYASQSKIQEVKSQYGNIDKWINNPETMINQCMGLYIWGDWARGKSSCAAIIAKNLLKKGIFSLWLEYADIPSYRTKDAYFSEGKTMLERAEEVDLLIINEFNPKKYQKQFPIDCVEHLVRGRVARDKPTIITSNTKPTQFTQEGNTKEERELHSMLYGLLAIMPEAFESTQISGVDMRKKENQNK